jgi:acetyl-CoA synthetase
MSLSPQQYHELYHSSIHHPETFWAEQAKRFITWYEPWERVLSGGFDQLDTKWFSGAKLNVSYNCLDRHLATNGDRVALIWESDDPAVSLTITYRELWQRVMRMANVLRAFDIQKGDKVCIYLPMIPEAVITMLACARIGAVHSVVFAGFSSEALKTRIIDADCRLVITANEALRGNKIIPLKKNVDQALTDCPLVKKVIVVQRTQNQVQWNPTRDVWYHIEMNKVHAECEPSVMDAQDPLFILYTSGSTGKPKGILHGTGGYLLYAAMTFHTVFDHQPTDIFWCTADVGWITGHTYGVYGPLANAATIVLFEGVPTYPSPARYWEVIDKYRVSLFYTAPTAIRALRREGDEWLSSTKRTSLRVLGSVGEPINPEAWEWYYHLVGKSRCPIVDTWWQTETGGMMISPLANVTPLKPGSVAWPFFGVVPQVVDEQGEPLPANTMGMLIIKQPWPGIMQTIYGNHERFIDTYFRSIPGVYLTGDQAYQDDDGYFWISGRSDDVIKVSGHRIGTQEIESALILHPAVAEAAVVGIPDAIKGQVIYAYVTLKVAITPSDQLKAELSQTVRDSIGAIAVPAAIQWANALPKTRSGKIMRRLLRKIAENEVENLGDLSTLTDPNVINDLIKQRN